MNNDGLTLNQLAERNAALVTELEKLRTERDRLAADNIYLLNGAARELNTSWMFHKTMLGAQAALACLSLGMESAARNWLEGTTDEAVAEIPDDITVAGLQAWFDSQMVSNDGKSGFLTRKEAEEAIRKACPATDRIYAGIKASTIPEGFKLVPEQMYLSVEDIQAICMQCGNGDKKGYGDYEDGILWVGELSNDGEMKYGLNIANANYPEEGSITVFEFDEPLREGAK
ncbi:hypothetical protein QVN03_18250 [Raoultella terrigena]|uniref:hypothetical protein n=1 Tax=Raoultella terrigena TaxID=577 RepID=UPI0025B22F56|nr:hypothetical protein [Raoultella terrigena]WJV37337.1 hypothetical protein QVN03_18250 [Raoultella terrigena]